MLSEGYNSAESLDSIDKTDIYFCLHLQDFVLHSFVHPVNKEWHYKPGHKMETEQDHGKNRIEQAKQKPQNDRSQSQCS